MNLIWVSLVAAGVLVSLIGSVWGLVLAFRTSIWWGLSWLFLPFAALIFLLVHFKQAKGAALTILIGAALLGVGFSQAPQSLKAAIAQKPEDHAAKEYAIEQPKQQVAVQPSPVAAIDPQVQLNDCIARAQKTCAELTEKRAKTNPDDKAAVAAFNAQVLDYNALLEQIKTLQAQVKTP